MRAAADPLALYRALEAAPYRFDFLHTLRKIDCLFPDKPRWGTALSPADEALRLGQEPALSFAAASLSVFNTPPGMQRPLLQVRFMGLLGPNGPLPLHLTEYARSRQLHAGDAAFTRFLDLINHRFLAFFYRAWAQANPAVSLDRPQEDRFGIQLGALMGFGMQSLRRRQALPDTALLHHAGLMARRVRNAEGLAKLLAGYFQVPVKVEEFVGHWMTLDTAERSRLGRGAAQLGRNAVSGKRVWDRQHKIRIVIGPLDRSAYDSFLPGGGALPALADALRSYLGFELAWDLRLILARSARQAARLGQGGRLGWSLWSGRRAASADAADLLLDVEHALARHPLTPAAA